MKVPSFVAENIVIKAFGRELERLRNHPELAWQRAWWSAATDASIFDKHDAIKEMAFHIYGVAKKLRLKSMLPPMGAVPTDPELQAHWCDDHSQTEH
jgi:hypothetical protein